MGLALVVEAFLIFYFARNIAQIKNNQDNIKKNEDEVENIKKEMKIDRKLLNTIDNIMIARGVYKK